jgi:hypothetical protein
MFGHSAFDRFCQLEGALSRHYDASDHHVVWRLSEPSLANHGHVVARGRKHDLHRVARVAARPARAGTERLSNVIGIGKARLSGFHGFSSFSDVPIAARMCRLRQCLGRLRNQAANEQAQLWRGGRESPLLERTDGGLIAAGPGATQAASKAKSIDGSIRSNVQPVLGSDEGLEVT